MAEGAGALVATVARVGLRGIEHARDGEVAIPDNLALYADELRHYLVVGKLAGLGEVVMGNGRPIPAPRAARIVLAELGRLAASEDKGALVEDDRWARLEEEVRRVLLLAITVPAKT
jgi:hypothetical protein